MDSIEESYYIPRDVGGRIKSLRQRFGLSQQQFADLIDVSVPLLKQWENGQTRPSLSYWQRMALAEVEGIQALSHDGLATRFVREPGAGYRAQEPLSLDFAADANIVRTVVEGERLTYGYLFNPAFATEISLIDPLPHQRMAVYDHMLKQPRLRFLLADDAGAGKTIMTGLYIREMLTRRLISRVLIVPPAGLVGNWERELRTLFNLPFRIITGHEARSGNPFTGPRSDLLIASLDTLAGERMFARLQEDGVLPYDLVVFDEAHKLAADREADLRLRKTDRYRLAQALAGISGDDERWSLPWAAHHLLLLTATPHMGKDFPYYCLWRLLEPDALSTIDAFNAYPRDARQQHFLRRTKEELVDFAGHPLYPERISDTLSYKLTQGEESEQQLYDATTQYIQTNYNRARTLNRSAARLAMSVFQRRLASSTYALLRSFERRAAKLEKLIDDLRSGRLTSAQLQAAQHTLDEVKDTLDVTTADEEEVVDGEEAHERSEDELLGGVLATSLADLEQELAQVRWLLELARRVYAAGEESKFEKLREILRDPRYQQEKLIIFTEHRDTLEFLVHRLEGMGFTGQIAQIHGGMNYQEREEQVAAFRRPVEEGGALYMVATDAAGEGINLQVCWLMVNYDIPWNPARLEQRMGRIHRYGQKHDPVVILNLVAGKTREGRVLQTLLRKLEDIRKELGNDKVFDVIGKLFEGLSLREYMEQLAEGGDEDVIERRITGTLTPAQVRALEARERAIYGDGGAVKSQLPRLRADMEQETFRRLLPGYVRHFIEQAAPLMDIGIEGDLDSIFTLRPLKPGAMDWLLPILEAYPLPVRERYTVYPPRNGEQAMFLHPSEPVFDRLRAYFCDRFSRQALQGAVFVDPTAERPYFYHLAQVVIARQADPTLFALSRDEVLEYRLVGLKHEEGGDVVECPAEQLLLLRGSDYLPASVIPFAANSIDRSCELAQAYALAHIAEGLAEQHRERLRESLPERSTFIERGFAYQAAELAEARSRLSEKASTGNPHAKSELTRIKARQREVQARKDEALAVLRHEPELIMPGEITFLAHALVVPSGDPEDQKRYDANVEAIAMQVVRAYEEALGAIVYNVSTAEQALAVELEAWPGFDLRSQRPSGDILAIEVKGRAGIGDVELTENEYIRACNLRERYWLYVVYDCAKAAPRLLRIQDPFGKLIVRAKGSVIVGEGQIFAAAESEV